MSLSEAQTEESREINDDPLSNSAEASSDEEDGDEEKIIILKQKLESNPYTYDQHLELISLYKKVADLDGLRTARENMSKLFPLSPELWIDWITDEEKLAVTDEEKKKVYSIFERAIKDYLSVAIWLEYIQYATANMGNTDEEVAKVRELFERALTAVGIHVTQATVIWEAYREFEYAYLGILKHKHQDDENEEVKKQEERVYNIFKRQLSVPLLGMEKTFQLFREDFDGKNYPPVDQPYAKALQKLNKLKKYEDALLNSEAPHLEEYKNYIQYETKDGDPIRVQHIYERAMVENCLNKDLWQQYTKYLDKKVKIRDLSIPVHERAVSNCPWSTTLWINYARSLERYVDPHNKIIEVFESALIVGLTKAEEFKEIWLAYLDYLRRQCKKDENKEADFQEITSVFERAAEQMKTYFLGTESEYSILKYWALFEAKYKKNMERAREIWEIALTHGNKEDVTIWLDYANFERLLGHFTHYKKVLLRSLGMVREWHEMIINLLITYEREEGTLESLERMIDKCEAQMQKVNDKRNKAETIATKYQKREERRLRKYALNRHQMKSKISKISNVNNKKEITLNKKEPAKKESNIPVQMDSEGFKIPPPPDKIHLTPENKNETAKSPPSEKLKRSAPSDENVPEPKKQKVEAPSSHGISVEHDPLKDDRTVFLSNLSYQLEEEKIREFFSQVGEIEEIRLVKDYKGRSKGFCYVVYACSDDAKKALEKDRELIDGRPVLVSPCEDKKRNPNSQPKFKFGTGLERNKLFVKGLPFKTTKEEIENMFKEFGALKDVRLVTYRSGHSKGLAYIDYEDETSAAAAVVKMDGSQVMDNVISVAISNPPPRKPKKEFSSSTSVTIAESLGGGQRIKGPRGRGRTQVSLLPRSLLRPQACKPLQNGQNSTTESKPLTNSDFASMLLIKK